MRIPHLHEDKRGKMFHVLSFFKLCFSEGKWASVTQTGGSVESALGKPEENHTDCSSFWSFQGEDEGGVNFHLLYHF